MDLLHKKFVQVMTAFLLATAFTIAAGQEFVPCPTGGTITIHQEVAVGSTGKVPIWNATIIDECFPCYGAGSISLHCPGFQQSWVRPGKMTVMGDGYCKLVPNGYLMPGLPLHILYSNGHTYPTSLTLNAASYVPLKCRS